MTRPPGKPRTLRFQAPARVIDGPGAAARLPHLLAEFGARRALLITGPTVAERTALLWYLEQSLGDWHAASYSGAGADAGAGRLTEVVELARLAGADCLVSVGGGRAIDLAKAARQALAAAPSAIRHIAIPTTLAGAAFTPRSLVSRAATETNGPVNKAEAPPIDLTLLDPRLTLETPKSIWQASGAATLRHAERMRAADRHPLSRALAREAIRLLRRALRESAAEPTALMPRGAAQIAVLMAYTGAVDAEPGND